MMKLSTLFTVHSLIAVIFGLGFTLIPGPLLSFYDVSLPPGGILVAQLFGVTLISIAILAWFARNTGASEARQAIVIALLIGNTLGFIIALLGQLAGVANALGWSTVAIYLLLALGYAYFQFMRTDG